MSGQTRVDKTGGTPDRGVCIQPDNEVQGATDSENGEYFEMVYLRTYRVRFSAHWTRNVIRNVT